MISWWKILKSFCYPQPLCFHCCKIDRGSFPMSSNLFEVVSDQNTIPRLFPLEFFSQTHVLRNFCTQPPLCNLSFSGTFSLSSNRTLFSTSIAPVTVSHLCSMCSTHNLKASSMSGLVTILAFLADSAVGVAASLS